MLNTSNSGLIFTNRISNRSVKEILFVKNIQVIKRGSSTSVNGPGEKSGRVFGQILRLESFISEVYKKKFINPSRYDWCYPIQDIQVVLPNLPNVPVCTKNMHTELLQVH